MYLYARPLSWRRSITEPERWKQLCGLDDDTPKRAGTLVLYVRPPDSTNKKLTWSFGTAEGRGEYEKALHKHLAEEKIVSAEGTAYKPMTSSADIARLARDTFENLVLIVHSAANGPAIGVDISSGRGDWLKDGAIGKVLAPLAYTNVTILGCDAVENKFAPSLATHLPKGSTVLAHQGGDFVIKRHFEKSKKIRGRAILTSVSSNFNLKTFKGGK
jgi:hypothetical protein